MQRHTKIACNATNSAAIDQDGRLWVWGSGRFGLLGKGQKEDRKVNQFVPRHLKIPPDESPLQKVDRPQKYLDAYLRKEPLSNRQNSNRHVVKDIAMGPCHMGIITIDEEIPEITQSITDANELFLKIRTHFLQEKDHILQQLPLQLFGAKDFIRRIDNAELQAMLPSGKAKITDELAKKIRSEFLKSKDVHFDDKQFIEWGIMQEFEEDFQDWPNVPFEKFYNMLFKTCKINFSENLGRITDELQHDLCPKSDTGKKKINIKQLRDVILGEQQNHNKVWLWGLKDERVGQAVISSQDKTGAIEKYESLKVPFDEYQEPLEFPVPGEPIKIVCGHAYCLVLTKQHEVYSWGIGNSGSLGQGFKSEDGHQASRTPTLVYFPEEKILNRKFEIHVTHAQRVLIKAIASGSSHCLALTTNGNVFSWGNGQGGRLGHGNTIGKDTPIQIMALAHKTIEQVACGESHSACITSNYELYMWGVGLNGRLGMALDQNYLVPELVQDLSQTKIHGVFLGMNTSIAIDKSYMCYVWGSGKHGKLGLNSDDKNYSQPRKLFTMFKEQVTEFASGPFHTLALTNSGKIFAFGNSKDGKLGISADSILLQGSQSSDAVPSLSLNVLLPQQLEVHDGTDYVQFNLKSKKLQVSEQYDKFKQFTDEFTVEQEHSEMPCVIQTVCTLTNSYFLLNNGQVWACGQNQYYQCGTQDDAEGEDDEKRLQVFITAQQTNWTDEIQEKRQLIENEIFECRRTKAVKKPRQIRIQQSINRIKQEEHIVHIACGQQHVIVTTFNGQCYAWGNNYHGQLGLFKEQDKISKPTLVEFFTDRKMKMAAAGNNHSLFLSDLGQVFAAGFNEFGQLGIQSEELKQQNVNQHVIKIDQIDNWVTSLKESAIKQVAGLEGIRFIACGAFHSLAVSDFNNDEGDSLALYSWGWGAYGQLGHSNIKNSFNLRKPKQVKFKLGSNKIAFVAAATKHTLCLDIEGGLWYFGLKEAVGVNSSDPYQFEPVKLQPIEGQDDFLSFRKGFSMVAASDTNNYVLTAAENRVFNFGTTLMQSIGKDCSRDKMSGYDKRKVHFTDFKAVEGFQAKYISCGPKHSILVSSSQDPEQDGLPFAWGINSNHQFGKLRSKMKTDDPQTFGTLEDQYKEKEDEVVTTPVLVKPFKDVFDKLKQDASYRKCLLELQRGNLLKRYQANEASQDKTGSRSQQRRVRFDVQVDIQNSQGISNSEDLCIKDNHLQRQFNLICREFYRMLNSEQDKINNDIARAQDAFISRVLNFPTPVDTLEKVQNNIPKSIVRNRQIYEQIFTYLQVHPCYLINWITQIPFKEEALEVRHLINAIFGRRELVNNRRIVSTLVVVASEIFKTEIRKRSLKEICNTFRTDSTFKTLFNFIYESQTMNLNFNRSVIKYVMDTCLLPKLRECVNGKDSKALFKSKIQIQSVRDDTLKFMDAQLRKSIEKFNQTQTTSESDLLSDEILSLINFTYSQLQEHSRLEMGRAKPDEKTVQKQENLEDCNELIVPYLLDMLFGNFLGQLASIDSKRLSFEYCTLDYNDRDKQYKKYFKLLHQNNTLFQLSKSIESCLKGTEANDKDIKNEDAIFSANPQINEIARKLFLSQAWKPLRFDILLIRQMFLTSLELKEPNLVVEVNDIVFIQNTLLDHLDRICIKEHEDDPIRLLLDELGNTKLPSGNSRQRLNFRISARLLLQQPKFVKCKDCQAPVTKLMLPKERFLASFKGIEWKCTCTHVNKQGHYICQNLECQHHMPLDQLPRDLVFARFSMAAQETRQHTMKLFYDVLSQLPIIEEHGDILKLIDEEVKYMEDAEIERTFTQTDFQKTQKLKKFKETVEAHIREREQEGLMKIMASRELKVEKSKTEDNKKLATMFIEQNFFDELADKIRVDMQHMKLHNAKIVDYETMLNQLAQMKQSKFIQTTQTCIELKQIAQNAYTGVASEFLTDVIKKQTKETLNTDMNTEQAADKNFTKTLLWAGRLHQGDASHTSFTETDQKRQDLEASTSDESGKITQFYNRLARIGPDLIKANDEAKPSLRNEAQQDLPDPGETNKQVNRNLIGTFSTVQLQHLGVIKEIPATYEFDVLRESRFVFNDNGSGGFHVELSYTEVSPGSTTSQEAVLESFEISREQLAEMRRNFACQVVAIMGKTKFQFDVFQLVKVLNKVVSQNNVFAQTALQTYQAAEGETDKKKTT